MQNVDAHQPTPIASNRRPKVNNSFYDALGERWFDDPTHAIAFLKQEAKLKLDYIEKSLGKHGIKPPASLLDVGCGGGFLALPLAAQGYHVSGIDQAQGALTAAAKRATPKDVLTLTKGDANALPYADNSFDSAIMMDVLEHLEPSPQAALKEVHRVLRPGGVLIFHTFNRTPLAALIGIHALTYFTKDCPPHVHVYDLFIPPKKLQRDLRGLGFQADELCGLRPKINLAMLQSIVQRRVRDEVEFCYSRSLAVGYMGVAAKL